MQGTPLVMSQHHSSQHIIERNLHFAGDRHLFLEGCNVFEHKVQAQELHNVLMDIKSHTYSIYTDTTRVDFGLVDESLCVKSNCMANGIPCVYLVYTRPIGNTQ